MNRDRFAGIFRDSMWVFSARIMNAITTQSDNLIVAAMIDPRYTVILSVTKKAAEVVGMIAGRISSAVMPGMANLLGEGKVERTRRLMLDTLKLTFIAFIIGMGGVYIANREFVELWVGKEHFGGQAMTTLICFNTMVFIVNSTLYSNLCAFGEFKTVSKATTLESLTMLPISVVMARYLGINGILIASIVAGVIANFRIQARRFVTVLGVSFVDLRHGVAVNFLKTSIPVVACYFARSYLSPVGLREFIAYCLGYLILVSGYYYAVNREFIKHSLRYFTGNAA
jgi:O-antigen/teichoic acid export membrane protein